MSKRVRWMLVACAVVAMTSRPQESHGASNATGTDPAAEVQALGEIVVTAQRREENLQKVPISVTAISAETAQSTGIRTADDLEVAVPSLATSKQTNAMQLFIRGVGTQGGTAGQDAAVATFIDGVYTLGVSATQFSLNNVDRIEVLKGPQGTLFGRNATGGAINIITRTPSHESHLEASIGYGNFGTQEDSLYGTVGLAEQLAADLAIYYLDQADGVGHNLVDGEKAYKQGALGLRSKWLWTPSEATKITFTGDYTRDDGTHGLRPTGTALPLLSGRPFSGNFWDLTSNVDQRVLTRQKGVSVRIDEYLSSMSIVSISAWRNVEAFQHQDLDGSPVSIVDFALTSTDQMFTQEVQLLSPADSKVRWIAGAFFLDGYSEYNPFQLFGAALAPASSIGFNRSKQDTTSIAGFGQMTIPVAASTNFTLGARFTSDKRELRADSYINLPTGTIPQFAPLETSKTFSKPTWRIGLDHQLSSDTMAYITYNRGFNSGVYNLSSPTDPPVNPEVLDAVEFGVKTDLLQRRLRLNTAAFWYDYKDIQLQHVVNNATLTLNAAAARIYGLDVDATALLTDRFKITVAMDWLHDRYTSFPNAPILTPNPNFPFGSTTSAGEASGNRMILTPDYAFSVAGDYLWALASGELRLTATYYYNDGFFWEPDNRVRQTSYHLVNAQLRWDSPEGKYNVRLWGKNLLNEKYFSQVSETAFGDSGTAAPPRTYGASFGVKF